tara:strand:- start:460 stop:1056 length:597 start_codon:yes stop_codon:yes gene_type:complete
MIEFKYISDKKPFLIFRDLYELASSKDQKRIEAMAISSYNKNIQEVDSRFVNLKFIDNNNFIFFSNYESAKASAFESFDQISALFLWNSINTQIRIKGKIERTSISFNKSYFKKRSKSKNALAISSDQSKKIESFDKVLKNYQIIKEKKNLTECPSYWGGFSFTPYSFEFWYGGEHRLNKRDLYEKKGEEWVHSILQP